MAENWKFHAEIKLENGNSFFSTSYFKSMCMSEGNNSVCAERYTFFFSLGVVIVVVTCAVWPTTNFIHNVVGNKRIHHSNSIIRSYNLLLCVFLSRARAPVCVCAPSNYRKFNHLFFRSHYDRSLIRNWTTQRRATTKTRTCTFMEISIIRILSKVLRNSIYNGNVQCENFILFAVTLACPAVNHVKRTKIMENNTGEMSTQYHRIDTHLSNCDWRYTESKYVPMVQALRRPRTLSRQG